MSRRKKQHNGGGRRRAIQISQREGWCYSIVTYAFNREKEDAEGHVLKGERENTQEGGEPREGKGEELIHFKRIPRAPFRLQSTSLRSDERREWSVIWTKRALGGRARGD